MHKKAKMPLVLPQGRVLEMQHKLQVARRKAKRESAIKTHLRIKELWQKRSHGTVQKSGVLIVMNWGTLLRTMER